MSEYKKSGVPSDYLFDAVLRAAAAVCSLDPDTGWLVCETSPSDAYVLRDMRRELITDGASCAEIDAAMNEACTVLQTTYSALHSLEPEDFHDR